MSERKVKLFSSFDNSLAELDEFYKQRLNALRTNPLLPHPDEPVILEEWDALDKLRLLINTTPANNPRYRLLLHLSQSENYYVFVHSAFRAYFVLDVSLDALVGLLIRRSHSDKGEDLLALLQKALDHYRAKEI